MTWHKRQGPGDITYDTDEIRLKNNDDPNLFLEAKTNAYFSTAGEVYRQKIVPGRLVPDTGVQLILKHNYKATLPSYEHIAKSIAFDDSGHLYVPFGAPGDSCQQANRRPSSPGQDPCPELDGQGGIWQFDANRESVNVVPSVALQNANVVPLFFTLVQLMLPCQWDTSIPWMAKSVPLTASAAAAVPSTPAPAAP